MMHFMMNKIKISFCIEQMGYGSRALSLLKQYYRGEVVSLSETVDSEPQTNVVDGQVTYKTLTVLQA